MALTKIDDRGLTTPIDLLDNEKIRFGTGNDLEVYHDGSHSRIDNSTGYLTLRSNQIALQNAAGDHDYVKCSTNEQGVELFYDNVKKFNTTSAGAQLTGSLAFMSESTNIAILDNGKAKFGNGDDLQIYHNGNNSYLENSTGWLTVKAANFSIDNAAGDESSATFVENGAASLYYDNALKFKTRGDGVNIYGHALFGDSNQAIFGAGNDLKIYHDATNSWISNTTGALYLKTAASNSVYILDNNNDTLLSATDDAGIVLCWDNATKLETKSSGVGVTGNLEVGSGQITCGVHGTTGIQIIDDGTFGTLHSADLKLRTASATRVTIDTSGNVGIQTTSPDKSLTIGGTVPVIKTNDGSGRTLELRGGSTSHNPGLVSTYASGLYLGSNGTESVVVGEEHLTITNGNLVVASGHGIDFSAKQNNQTTGATTGSELLEHYEEGTWTPTFVGSTANPTLSGQIATGIYTKIGNLVTVTYYSGSFTLSGSPGGTPYIGGLPFTAKSTGNNYATAYFAHTSCFNADACGYVNNGGNSITVLQTGDTTAGNTWESSGTKYLMVHFTYLAA